MQMILTRLSNALLNKLLSLVSILLKNKLPLLLLLPITLTKIRIDPSKELPMPLVTIVDKKDILSEIVMPGSKITKGTTKDTNPEVEVIITLLGITSPMIDQDLETEADPGTETIIITALDMIDPEAEVNLVIDTEMTGTIDPLTDPGSEIALLLLTLVMYIQSILQMIILM